MISYDIDVGLIIVMLGKPAKVLKTTVAREMRPSMS